MTTYDTTFDIDAAVAQVWEVLTDFPRYPEWNSAVSSLAGDLSVGSVLAIRLEMGSSAMDVKATVTEVESESRFAWRGKLGAEFLFTGIRAFTLESQGEGTTRVRHLETVQGLIVPPFVMLKRKALAEHHNGFNRSLKERAEELAQL
ncbi:MAG TPA: SRPBCC domain-containing protein [Nocardioidaceae bacterium]|nr:SRPBCC domain-containing protein [Nocardioidaceae bacterium]